MKIYPNIRALEQSLAATSKDVKNLYNDIENLKKWFAKDFLQKCNELSL